MPVKDEVMVPVRFTVPRRQAEKMNALADSGDYPALAEVYREAVREYLDKRKPHTAVQQEESGCPATS